MDRVAICAEALHSQGFPSCRIMISRVLFLFVTGCLIGAPVQAVAQQGKPPARVETMAEAKLRRLVERERNIIEEARQAGDRASPGSIEAQLQSLISGFDGLIREAPDFAAAYTAYGLLLRRVGEDRAARSMLLKANQLDPNIPQVKNALGNFLTEEAKYKEALPYYLAAIQLDPREPLYHYQLGSLLYEFRDHFVADQAFDRPTIEKQMSQAFRTAANLGPDTVAYAYRYAESFYDLEAPDWNEALRVWNLIEENTRPGIERQTVALHKANVFIKMGRPEEARPLLDTVVEPILASNKRSLVDQLPVAADN
jgi:tetratricopeptide (TPR) repeat protein